MGMLHLFTLLEKWVLEDGNYPHFRKNNKVNLAFYIKPYDFFIAKNRQYKFTQIKYYEYDFCGKIIYKYSDGLLDIIVVDTNEFKFYMELNKNIKNTKIGNFIQGRGKLLIDYYNWAKNMNEYKNHPDIFYNLIIEKIYSIKIPEKFIKTNENTVSYPSSLKIEDINYDDINEIEETNTKNNQYEFYLIELNEIDEQMRMTFNNFYIKS
jgi:hypothetical protein